MTLNNKNPCNHCSPMARALCTRNVDRGTEDILARRAPRPPLYGDDGLPVWVDGHYTDEAKRSPHIKKWRRWREHCRCCGRSWLVFMGGKARVRNNGKCDQPSIPIEFCTKCKAFLKRELGDRALMTGRQRSWDCMGETERELARKANMLMFEAAARPTKEDVLRVGNALHEQLEKLKSLDLGESAQAVPSPINAALLKPGQPRMREFGEDGAATKAYADSALEAMRISDEELDAMAARAKELDKSADPAGGITT